MTLTMRNSLVATISLMGLLVVVFALVAGEIYSKLSLENRAAIFEELAELEVHHRWHQVRDDALEMGLSIRQDLQRKKISKEQDEAKAVQALNEHFHRGYVTLGLLDLKELAVYDANLNLRSHSTEVNFGAHSECPGFLETLSQRSGADRLKSISRLCSVNDELRLMVVMPLGGLKVSGYLSMVVDPLKNLAGAEAGLGIPLTIRGISGKSLYRSSKWPVENALDNGLLVSYWLHAGNPETVAEFQFVTDVTGLRQQLNKTRSIIIFGALLITGLVVFLALGHLNRSIIKPLSKITKHLNRIRHDNHYLKESILVNRATPELETLASDLNAMSSQLHQLYGELEVMAFTDDLTGIPNRALFFEHLNQTIESSRADEPSGEFILMVMDLNRFKKVNDRFGHYIGDLLLKEVANRLTKSLRSDDTVARLGGDEFAVQMYSGSDEKMATVVAEKITQLMSQEVVVDGHTLDIGMSIGIAHFPTDAASAGDLMHCADIAMYYAKQNNIPFVFYSDDVQASHQLGVKGHVSEVI